MIEDVGDHGFVGAVENVGGGRPFGAHAHVERAVVLEGEATLGFVQLHGGDADVEHDAVDGRPAGFGSERVEVAEAAVDET